MSAVEKEESLTRELLLQLPGRRILVTGGSGFIGACFVRWLLRCAPTEVCVYNLDNMEYCANTTGPVSTRTANGGAAASSSAPLPPLFPPLINNGRYHFVQGSILNADLVSATLREGEIDTIVHMAALTHVDNSFTDSLRFTEVNVLGTHTLLECARRHGKLVRFLHVSTDEVYGETPHGTPAAEETSTVLRPTNPYAASKAAAEHLVSAYYHSFKLPIVISRGNNVFGPGQYPEKVIPRFITCCLGGELLPVQGDGHHQRSFLYVEDVVRGLLTVLVHGTISEVYNVASEEERSVNEIARRVVAVVTGSRLEVERPDFEERYVCHVADRAYNDARYFMRNDRLAALGWSPQVSFEEGLRRTVDFYRANPLNSGYWKGL